MWESWRSALSVLHQASLKPDSLGGLPLMVLTREDINEDERRQQIGYLQLSRNAKRTIAVHSGHFIQIDRPDLVIASVKEILAKSGPAAKENANSLRGTVK